MVEAKLVQDVNGLLVRVLEVHRHLGLELSPPHLCYFERRRLHLWGTRQERKPHHKSAKQRNATKTSAGMRGQKQDDDNTSNNKKHKRGVNQFNTRRGRRTCLSVCMQEHLGLLLVRLPAPVPRSLRGYPHI